MTQVTTLATYRDEDGNTITYEGTTAHKVKINFKGANNRLIIAPDAKLLNLAVDFDCDNGAVQIGGNQGAPALRLSIRVGQDSAVTIGDNVSSTANCYLTASEGAAITVGNDVMFATGNEIRADDGHPIFDVRTGKRVNPSKSITVGNHVWLGKDAVVLAGGRVGDGSVIGYGSLVTSPIANNCIAVGIPARMVRRDVAWERPHLSLTRPFYKPDASTVRRSAYWHLTAADGEEPKQPRQVTPARVRVALRWRARRLLRKFTARS